MVIFHGQMLVHQRVDYDFIYFSLMTTPGSPTQNGSAATGALTGDPGVVSGESPPFAVILARCPAAASSAYLEGPR